MQCQHQLMLRQSLLVRTHSTIERIHAVQTCTITTIHCMERTYQMMYCTRDNSICSGAAPHSLPAAGLRLGEGTYDIILVDFVAHKICYRFRIKISITKRKIALYIVPCINFIVCKSSFLLFFLSLLEIAIWNTNLWRISVKCSVIIFFYQYFLKYFCTLYHRTVFFLIYFDILFRYDDDLQTPQAAGPLSQACVTATCKFLY